VPEPGDDAPILILTGPPGAGKTTAAEVVAGRSARAVHLESDAFFHFIRSGYVEPWKTASHEQNQIVMRIVAQAGAEYAQAGYLTVIDGIVIPGWFFEPLRDALHSAGHGVAYAVLRAPLSVCIARARDRKRGQLENVDVVKQLWQSFSDLGDLERNVLDLDGESPEAVAEILGERMADGSLLV
jgi:tRNA uridine 5-carbamoylmethylation protein Kti12